MAQHTGPFSSGQRVVVTQQIPQRDEVWTTNIIGTIRAYEQRKTGAWYSHAKDNKLWLDRLTVEKDDGEIVVCNLDGYTRVQLVAASQPPTAAAEASDADAPDAEALPPSEEN